MSATVISRRSLVAGAAGASTLLALGGTASALAGEGGLLRPPGGQDEFAFLGACIRCDRCRQACPMKVIESSGLEDGLINVRTPKLDFRKATLKRTLGTTEYQEAGTGYCDFCDPDGTGTAEKRCVAVCPTGALRPFDQSAQRIGLAVIDEVYCINFPQIGQTPTGCRLCVEACPYGAVVMNDEQRPEVISSKCNGCGKCEAVCPSANYRAVIGLGELEERAAGGSEQYVASLEFYRSTGRMPRGINVMVCDDAAMPRSE